MLKEYNISDKGFLILNQLFRSYGHLNFFSIYIKLKLPHSQLLKELIKLEKENLVSLAEDKVTINSNGKEALLRREYIKKDISWKEIPQCLKRNKLDINEHYIPYRNLL